MLEAVRLLLEQSPMLALFAVIGLGYALGRISIAGFSLGVGAVLFAGLAAGALAPKSAPPGLVSSIGLVMFLYGIGIQYGRQFFAGLSGPGLKWNLLAAAGVLGALAVTLALGKATGVSPAHVRGNAYSQHSQPDKVNFIVFNFAGIIRRAKVVLLAYDFPV